MIRSDVTISPLAHVEEGAEIGFGTRIGPGTFIGCNARIGRNCSIENGATIGYGNPQGSSGLTIVGDGSLIATGAVLYHSVTLGNNVKIRHCAAIREHVTIGEGTSIGSFNNVEHHSTIGRFCSLHSHCHVTDFSTLEDYVFMGPSFTSFSDVNLDYRRPQIHQPYTGITIRHGARIGGRVTALPGTLVESEAVVGAGSLIKGTLLAGFVYVGNPARAVSRVPAGQRVNEC